MSTLTFGFIGLGLIGGSIARAIRQNLPQSQIIAYDINADTLREASQCGVANTVTTKIDASFSTCDYLFLCAPVQKNDENLSAVKKILSPKLLSCATYLSPNEHEAALIAGNVIEKAERIKAWMGDNPENGRMPEVNTSSNKMVMGFDYSAYPKSRSYIPLSFQSLQ